MNFTLEDLEALARRAPVSDPNLHNPDSNPFYHFLYHVTNFYRPKSVLEIGTDKGDSACHLAAGCAESQIVTVDQATSPTIFDRIKPWPNVTFLHFNVNDVVGCPAALQGWAPFDIFYEDGEHSGGQVSGEWAHYVPLVRPGGLIIMDDINLPTGIRAFWDAIGWPKAEFPWLHDTGYGVVLKP